MRKTYPKAEVEQWVNLIEYLLDEEKSVEWCACERERRFYGVTAMQDEWEFLVKAIEKRRVLKAGR